jgi:dimeric dUTPase (all-alpha-NTP-PPase superfamily)
MNLQKLFELQRQLDEHIEKEHPRQDGEDRLAKKILALLVELGELCNCWRGFKFWSHDQEPRTEKVVVWKPKLKIESLPDDDIRTKIEHEVLKVINPLLEEYVDCLHFILSIGLEITEPDMLDLKRWNLTKADNITEQFLWVMADVTDLYNGLYHDGNFKFDYEYLLLQFIHLGEMLGFTWEQIEAAYMQKNAENHRRQDSNY